MRVAPNGSFITENIIIKMDDLGIPLFQETPHFVGIHCNILQTVDGLSIETITTMSGTEKNGHQLFSAPWRFPK